jgi:Na+-translocating ferredoxin:NAD+ oxidoreductase subunit B
MTYPAKIDPYDELAKHLASNTYGWLDYVPESGAFQKLLKEMFDEEEAGALINIPVKPIPLEFICFEEIANKSNIPKEKLEKIFDQIADRGLLFSGTTKEGKKGYSFLKRGYGFPQIFCWKGEKNEKTMRFINLENDQDLKKSYAAMSNHGVSALKPWRYIPVTVSLDLQWQSVYPTEPIEKVIENAKRFALANCPCRVRYELDKGKSCGHSKEVCIKLDELADHLIRTGHGKEITREEALQVIKKANKEGLVHFTENTAEDIKHICNCCGCACWNLVPIKKRIVPRDAIMAVYYIRETDVEKCTGCEICIDICPVDAIVIEEDIAKVDTNWCIGCGVCVLQCPEGAIKIRERENKPLQTKNLSELYTKLDIQRSKKHNNN